MPSNLKMSTRIDAVSPKRFKAGYDKMQSAQGRGLAVRRELS
jgi:hypothetical protein